MASIKTRVAGLEQANRATAQRQLTDAERAVRVAYILNNPACSSMHAPLRKILKRSKCTDPKLKSDVYPV